MKIPEFGTLLMNRTDEQHFGRTRVVPLTQNIPGMDAVGSVGKVTRRTEATSLQKTDSSENVKSFQDYLLEAMNTVNDQQLKTAELEQTLMTNPDEVDIHDVTIAMSKARMSLNLAQTVISRLVEGWNEITTTR